jgi:uncharacterized protein (TIGR02246 family)
MLLAAALTFAGAASAGAAEVTQDQLMQAATELGQQYDTNYNSKNASGMAGLYAPDGMLVSPGPVIRGTAELEKYYKSRFDLGATGHQTKILEVHVQGEGGYGIGQFAVTVPMPDGSKRELHGNLATIYQRGADGWHFHLVMANVTPPPPK